jgi:uncharacterized protein YkwD
MVKRWSFFAPKKYDESIAAQSIQLSFFKLKRKSSLSRMDVNKSQKCSPKRQVAIRNIVIEANEPPCSTTMETLDLHNCWEYLGSSSRNLMETTKSEITPCHTRNMSDTTTTSTVSVVSIDAAKLQAAAEFGKVVSRNRRLPQVVPGFISGGHLLVNKERISRHIPALHRRLELDQLANERADIMAKTGKVHRGDRSLMLSRLMPCYSFAENVGTGVSIHDIHLRMLSIDSDVKNMINTGFSEFGIGTAKGRNGKIYLCQVFKG